MNDICNACELDARQEAGSKIYFVNEEVKVHTCGKEDFKYPLNITKPAEDAGKLRAACLCMGPYEEGESLCIECKAKAKEAAEDLPSKKEQIRSSLEESLESEFGEMFDLVEVQVGVSERKRMLEFIKRFTI